MAVERTVRATPYAPRTRRAAPSGSFKDEFHHLQTVRVVALVSGRVHRFRSASSITANAFAAIGQ